MKKSVLLLVLTILLMVFIPVFSVSADTINWSDTYQYTGTGISGTTIGVFHVMKFNMTGGYVAFCDDMTVSIQTGKNYVILSLEDAAVLGVLTNPTKIRAILNYSWDKTTSDEITAVQHALWHYMNGHNLPSSASNAIETIYNKLLSDSETPPIPASDENVNNVLTLTDPSPNSQTMNGSQTTYTFDFSASSSTGAAIVFEVRDAADQLLNASNFTITSLGSVQYRLTLNNVSVPASFKLTATTLKHKSVGTAAFFTFKDDGNNYVIDKSISQTVVGIKPSSTLQSDFFVVRLNGPEQTETTATTTETTATTTAETTATTTATTIVLTDESIPLVGPTATPAVTTTIAQTTTTSTPTTVTIDDEEIPKTGEDNQGILIGFILVAMSVSLYIVMRRRESTKK